MDCRCDHEDGVAYWEKEGVGGTERADIAVCRLASACVCLEDQGRTHLSQAGDDWLVGVEQTIVLNKLVCKGCGND
jgi:hypothetical protein